MPTKAIILFENGDVEEFDPKALEAELASLRKGSTFFLLLCSPLGKECDRCQQTVCTFAN
jgi:predicted metal-binding protein